MCTRAISLGRKIRLLFVFNFIFFPLQQWNMLNSAINTATPCAAPTYPQPQGPMQFTQCPLYPVPLTPLH